MKEHSFDVTLSRLERGTAIAGALAAAIALVVRNGDPDVAAGIVGGWALVAASAWATKSSVTGLIAAADPTATYQNGGRASSWKRAKKHAFLLARFIGRYALLGIGAYVMIARLRLHPVGLLIGASSIVMAASFEAARTLARSRTI